MANEQDTATKYLAAVARPVASETAAFGDKLAVGTGAALVLIVSQLGDIRDFIPSPSLFVSVVLAVVSLLAYATARYWAIQAVVIADAEQRLMQIGKVTDFGEFDLAIFNQHAIDISVWPASWMVKFATWRKKKTSFAVMSIQNSQKVTRYVIFQIIAMFAALLVLFGSFSIEKQNVELATAVSSPDKERAATYICVDCLEHVKQKAAP